MDQNSRSVNFTVAEISSDQLARINSYTEDGLFDTAFHFNLGSMEELDLEKLTRDFKEMSQQRKFLRCSLTATT